VITVLLVDDQRAVRGAVRMQLGLEPDLRIVGEAGTVAQALELIAAIPALRASGSQAVVLTMHDEAALRERADRAGAAGFVGKFEPPQRLIEVIRSVASTSGPAPGPEEALR
jgi:DNA-binding NarL/FixJ family response regulator